MNELERLQAAIAAQQKRWIEKYGRVSPEECRYPTMEEEMRRQMELEWSREAAACMRMHIANAQKVDNDENQIESISTIEHG
ncbi:hypothetical protein [Burkholderia multivorans]|uniref:hypothetical protein n=1 Tax=Burkholderia multivorans TaxID=87883 RepID=UPI000F4E1117|nr:hypothetical protein [Burkholderia multivorans]MBU9120533.1 hypothetical protein [Burkholderia multivorans]